MCLRKADILRSNLVPPFLLPAPGGAVLAAYVVAIPSIASPDHTGLLGRVPDEADGSYHNGRPSGPHVVLGGLMLMTSTDNGLQGAHQNHLSFRFFHHQIQIDASRAIKPTNALIHFLIATLSISALFVFSNSAWHYSRRSQLCYSSCADNSDSVLKLLSEAVASLATVTSIHHFPVNPAHLRNP